MKSSFLILAGVVLFGWLPQPRTAAQFDFLQGGTAITTVTERVGRPDRELGSGQLRWEYDLADGTQLVIVPRIGHYEDQTTWQVAWWGQRRGTSYLWTKPADYQ